MVKGLPEMLVEIYSTFATPLIGRFAEREESVKFDVFVTFAELASNAVFKAQSPIGAPAPAAIAGMGILEIGRQPPPKERPAAAHLSEVMPKCIEQLNHSGLRHGRSLSYAFVAGNICLYSNTGEAVKHAVATSSSQPKEA